MLLLLQGCTHLYMEALGYIRRTPECPNLNGIILTNFCNCSYCSETPAKPANHFALCKALPRNHQPGEALQTFLL